MSRKLNLPRCSGLFPAEPVCPYAKRSGPEKKYRCEHDRRILPPVTYAEHAIEHEAEDRPGNTGAGQEFWRESRDF